MKTGETLAAFACPKCSDTRSTVADTRPTQQGNIRRRRRCLSCNERYTTFETISAMKVTSNVMATTIARLERQLDAVALTIEFLKDAIQQTDMEK